MRYLGSHVPAGQGIKSRNYKRSDKKVIRNTVLIIILRKLLVLVFPYGVQWLMTIILLFSRKPLIGRDKRQHSLNKKVKSIGNLSKSSASLFASLLPFC